MSLRPNAVLRLALLGIVGVTCGASTAGASLDKAIRESDDPARNASLIDAYVNNLVGKMVGDDVDTARKAREELVDQVVAHPPAVVPSADFKRVYSTSINKALTVAISSPDVRKRLAVAIVAARVAFETNSPSLQGVIGSALEDKSPAVCLWGIKGAGKILPLVVANGNVAGPEKLTPGLISAVDRFGDMPTIVLEAYDAAEMGTTSNNPIVPVGPALLDKAIDTTQKILRLRLQKAIAKYPVEPMLDQAPVQMLTRSQVLAGHRPAQLALTVDLITQLLSVVAQRAAGGEVSDLSSLASVMRIAGGALQVAAGPDNAALQGVLTPIYKMSPNRPGAQWPGLIDAVLPVVRSIPAFKNLGVMPKVTISLPATQPATATAAPAAP